MYNMYKCNIEQIVYPFYIIKKNLGIIPIDEEYDLSNRLEREGYIFKNNELLGNEDFNVYIPTYSKIIKATSQKKTKTNKIASLVKTSAPKNFTNEQIKRIREFDVDSFERWRAVHILKPNPEK
ncbi:MAG: hypothetical protein Ct9H90mP28_6310 [Paracoccaceae bacterium]|nr:MAG: hypothetical protein Ct9H90mP28_6310 [Paracoccaceae bacterium]